MCGSVALIWGVVSMKTMAADEITQAKGIK